jgi:hypothetical protein
MTLYLMRDEGVLPGFHALAKRLWAEDRFFAQRRALLSGPFDIVGRWAAPRVRISAAAVPFRPSRGVYVIVGPAVDGAALVEHAGVAGAWQFADGGDGRHVTVAFVDGDLERSAAALGSWWASSGVPAEWAGPLEGIDAFHWDWFATLTPQ